MVARSLARICALVLVDAFVAHTTMTAAEVVAFLAGLGIT